jgi:hypothetical protein
LPLYVFSGKHLVSARLRRSNIDASAGTVEELERIVGQIRERFPEVSILVRGDSAFAREEIMVWCERHDVDFCFGLARNSRLEGFLEPALVRAEKLAHEAEGSARVYEEMNYQTLQSWSRPRRVVGKAEWLPRGANPRFVVTSLSKDKVHSKELYETLYCARGDAENRIKEQQLDLFATRTSGRLMGVNQVRLWFSAIAYVLIDALRRLGLAGTSLANAYCGTIRTRLLKIGARVRLSVRRLWVFLTSAHPAEGLFAHAFAALQRAGP